MWMAGIRLLADCAYERGQPPIGRETMNMIALRTGLTAEAEEEVVDEVWIGGIRLRGQDGAGNALSLRLNADELAQLTTLAEEGLAEFLASCDDGAKSE